MPHRTPLLLGRHEPLGATLVSEGVNFAVFSENATRIELCVFDANGEREVLRAALHGPHNGVFHGLLPGAGPGTVYGLRAHGPYRTEQGHRFNPHKLLLDPYAREIVGRFDWHDAHSGYVLGDPDGPRSYDSQDNARIALKARVAPPPASAIRPARPRIEPSRLVLYEVHVKGFTQAHPGVPPALRGTYAGMGHPAAIDHLRKLGVTAVSLLPVHYAVDEPGLRERGLCNYWGYNTLGFFSPDPRYAATPDDPSAVNAEFRAMVDALHAAGIEVVLDVVYNHTAEGSELGPTLSFRGLDNASWYRLEHHDAQRCENLSGCGNTVNVAHPRVTQFVLDSLRYWVEVMGVDGFRFDLAPVLGRSHSGFHTNAAFFVALNQDPVLAGVHLIAEPWDAGFGGYQLGHFPGRFLEWNDRFRDTVRAFWLGRHVTRGEFARRVLASSDLFHHRQRQPTVSVNFVTAHDGFTLRDLVSYNHKHNHANGEDNRDGRSDELAHNFGVEGDTANPAILAARGRAARAMLATTLLAQGTPMLTAGDEIGKTQAGNNNAYCQDNPIGWLDWQTVDHALLTFAATVMALRASEPLLREPHWFHRGGAHAHVCGASWRLPGGTEIDDGEWSVAHHAALACALHAPTESGDGHRVFLAFNPSPHAINFVLPDGFWELLLDSGIAVPTVGQTIDSGILVAANSLVVLRSAGPGAAHH